VTPDSIVCLGGRRKDYQQFLNENLTVVRYNAIMSTKGEYRVGGQVCESEGCSGSHRVQSSTSAAMKNRKMLLPVLFSIALVFSLILTASVLNTAPVMARGQVTRVVGADTTVSTENYSPPECDVGDWTDIVQVAAGGYYTVGLKSDGTVVAVGYNGDGQCNVGDWADIIQVAAGGHTVGLKSDGTVVAVGYNYDGQCDVGGWANITQVAAGSSYTVGLKSNGTVVTVGSNVFGQRNVGSWTDIVQVAAGGNTLGLKSDGTVVAAGWNRFGQCNVGNWTDIVQVAAGGHTLGLKSDGTVVAIGYNGDGRCDVGNWTGIIQVAKGDRYTVGLKADGTVVAVGYNGFGQCDVGGWTDITQVTAGGYHTVGLKLDGTVVAAGGYESCSLPSFPTPCFIATAAYGTPMAGEIEILRQFRDEYLLTNPLGKALAGLYYRFSPPIAEFITEHPSLKAIVRVGLVPAVAISTLAVNTAPAEKAAVIGLLVLVSVALAVWVTRPGRGSENT
jgi:alpha-tubulin suppressor-like RCC1 family protein